MMKNTLKNLTGKVLGLLLILMLAVSYSCNDDDRDDDYEYIGTIDAFCDYLILVEKSKDNSHTEFVKPVNLDSSFEEQGLRVKVTFSYVGEKQVGCGGFVGEPEKVKIIKIKRL